MYQQLQQMVEERKRMALATVVETDKNNKQLLGRKYLITEAGVKPDADILQKEMEQLCKQLNHLKESEIMSLETESGEVNLLVESYHPTAKLIVLGGGHIAQPLVKIASLLQYQITVVDDRPKFANKQRFPEAHQVECDDFITALERQKIDSGTSVVIVTRGHKHDLQCLEYVLKFAPGYVGMIGSRRRVKMIKDQLLSSGYPEEKVDGVYMPIGLDINAQTPEEIAVSIAAQLVEVRRGFEKKVVSQTSTRQRWELLEREIDYANRNQAVVAATIVRTKGSTPRKAGAKMLILQDGTCIGTIGGGCGEAEVRREALMLFDSRGIKMHQVMLDAGTAAEEGMVCGGLMDVFIERLI
ncbi:MAG: xanthine dehydrogenase [Firmicutes bacterium]|nr:xanthine dehydrogenase [Bacillota bacterium]